MKTILRLPALGLSLLVLLLPAGLRAQDDAPVLHDPVPPAVDPSKNGAELGKDKAMADVHENLTYATVDGKPMQLDLFVPRDAAKPIPLVVWYHGGGLRGGARGWPRIFILPLIPHGYAVASVEYRLAPGAKWPAQLEDSKAAIRWLRANASQYGYDPDRIAAAGDSAGGHLATLLGTTSDRPELEGTEGTPDVSSAVQAVVDLFGESDITADLDHMNDAQLNNVAFWLGVSPRDDLAKARTASAVFYVDAKTPPFFIAHGTEDKSVPFKQSLEMDAALKKAGISDETYFIKGADHEFRDQGETDAMTAFLDKVLKPGQP